MAIPQECSFLWSCAPALLIGNVYIFSASCLDQHSICSPRQRILENCGIFYIRWTYILNFYRRNYSQRKFLPVFFVPTDHKKAIHSSIFVFEEIIPFGPKAKVSSGSWGRYCDVYFLKCLYFIPWNILTVSLS